MGIRRVAFGIGSWGVEKRPLTYINATLQGFGLFHVIPYADTGQIERNSKSGIGPSFDVRE